MSSVNPTASSNNVAIASSSSSSSAQISTPASHPAREPLPKTDKPSLMAEKFKSMPKDWLTSGYTLDQPNNLLPAPFKPTLYFFYGTLMQIDRLSSILDIPIEASMLKKARVVGYALENWGQYKALVDGDMGAIVTGMAYEVQSQEHADRLARYETNAYETKLCWIELLGKAGESLGKVKGKTFMYAGDAQALRDGVFDRVLWVKNMHGRA